MSKQTQQDSENKLDFFDYYRIKVNADENNETVTDLIQRHDKDLLTYENVYKVLRYLNSDINSITNQTLSISEKTTNLLISILLDKGIVDEAYLAEVIKELSKPTNEKEETDNESK